MANPVSNRGKFLIAGVALALVGAALWTWRARRASTTAPNAAESSSTGQRATKAGPGWSPGTQYTHKFSFSISLMNIPDGQTDGKEMLKTGFSGTMVNSVVDERPGLVDVLIELKPDKLTTQQSPKAASEPQARAFLKEMTQTFIASYDHDGRLIELYFKSLPPSPLGNFLKEMMSAFQFVGSASRNWNSLEFDMAGEYNAAYQHQEQRHYAKQKLHYLRMATPGGLAMAGSVKAIPTFDPAKATYLLDELGRIADMHAQYTYVLPLEAVKSRYRNSIDVQFELVQRRSDATLIRHDAIHGLSRTTVYGSKEDHETADESGLAGVVGRSTLTDIMGELERAMKNKSGPGVTDARFRLTAMFKLHPESAKQVPRDRYNRQVFYAMGSAGTAPAQQVLTSASKDSTQSLDQRTAAVDAMHSIENPSIETVDAVEQLTKDPDPEMRKQSSYAFGSLLRNLNTTDPESAADRVQKLVAALEAATTDAERVLLLDTLGNTGSVEAIPVFKNALASGSATVRSAAAKGLRMIPDAQADQLLATTMTTDPDAGVRESALFAAGYRPVQPLLPALEIVCKTDKALQVRSRAIGVVSDGVSRTPDQRAHDLLAWVAANDPEKSLRDQAAAAIGPKPNRR